MDRQQVGDDHRAPEEKVATALTRRANQSAEAREGKHDQ